MPTAKAKGTSYERLVMPLIQKFLTSHDYKITHRDGGNTFCMIGQSGCSHQIDVYLECENDTEQVRFIIECKDYATPISIGKIRDFLSVKNDIGDVEAWFVSRNGYTDLAKKFAKFYGIKLLTLDSSKIIAKSNVPPPMLGWNYFKLDDFVVDGDSCKTGVFINPITSEEIDICQFLNIYYDASELPVKSKKRTVYLHNNWVFKTQDGSVTFRRFTLYYRIIKNSAMTMIATLKNQYTIEANLESR